MTTITKARIHSTANLVLCDLARARRRAGITLARVHGHDELWRAALARDHFQSGQEKWAQFLSTTGENRAVARYEFLADFDAWIHAFSAPVSGQGQPGDLLITGMFGHDAILVSVIGSVRGKGGKRRANKLYRLLRHDSGKQKFPSLLRLPQTESLFMSRGEEAIAVETSDEQDDRIICGFDSLLVVARRVEDQLVYRVVKPGEKLYVSPFFLDQIMGEFVPASQLLKQAKEAIRSLTPEAHKAARNKTRIFRMTPTTAMTAPIDKIVGEPKHEKTRVVYNNAPVEDHLLDANPELVDVDEPADVRPSVSTALRLSESSVIVLPGGLMAIEAIAKEVSERTAKIENEREDRG